MRLHWAQVGAGHWVATDETEMDVAEIIRSGQQFAWRVLGGYSDVTGIAPTLAEAKAAARRNTQGRL